MGRLGARAITVVTLLWHMTSVVLLYLVLTAPQDSGRTVGSGDLCLAPRDGRVGGLDERAEEHAGGRVLPRRTAGLSEVRRVAPTIHYFTALCLFVLGLLTKTLNHRDACRPRSW